MVTRPEGTQPSAGQQATPSMTMNTTTASSPITKPMLADKCERLHALNFPLLATPKLDGIRCLKINGRALTRSFKPMSNRFIREWIEANLPDGLDGELIVKGTTFNETAGHVGRESGEPDFTFAVFDYVSEGIDVPYACRMQELARLPDYQRVDKVLPEEIHTLDDLMAYEERCVSRGLRRRDDPHAGFTLQVWPLHGA
jgi:DNA ligase-1